MNFNKKIKFLQIFYKNNQKNFSELSINNGKKIIDINAEIADDSEKRVKGFMFWKSMAISQ